MMNRSMATGAGDISLARDPRAPWFGRLLRKVKLNKLPPLIHLLKGDMSLAGPRP